jgi:hypothetical protein
MSNAENILDTINRNSSNVHAQLIANADGTYTVRYNIGANRGETAPMTREEADAMWTGLQRVGC